MNARLPVEPIFDQTPHLFGDGLPDPLIYNASAISLRQRTVNFAAKRYADMMFVSGLDRATADQHFRPRAALVPGGLSGRPVGLSVQNELKTAHAEGRFTVETNPAERSVAVTWIDPAFGDPIVGHAIARMGYGGIVLGPHRSPDSNPMRLLVKSMMPDNHGRAVERWTNRQPRQPR